MTHAAETGAVVALAAPAAAAPASPAPAAINAPQLCFGSVRHTRLRPVFHAFQYGIYFIRLPLRSMAQQGFSARAISRNRFNLLSFHDCDHGAGDGRQPLLEWIEQLLRSHGIDDADGEIWLQIFPRVLGYVFNPVSFWFCHRADGSLRAVLSVVNNTFGEHHSYLLDAIAVTGPAAAVGAAPAVLTAAKTLHVSPFCQVEGTYHFRFNADRTGFRAAPDPHRHMARIDYHDRHGPLIYTSVAGSPTAITTRGVLRAFFRYPMMTVGVVLKIHLQALRLWCKRVPFHSKPVPPDQEVSR